MMSPESFLTGIMSSGSIHSFMALAIALLLLGAWLSVHVPKTRES